MEKGKHRVSVIIPNYNRKKDLERLMPSIANQTFTDYEVIVVDDASPDRSAVQYIRDFIKDRINMRLVENTENIGFVKTCNKGIELCSSKYICILTNDTEVRENFLQRNVEIMDANSSIGVLSCIIVDKDGNNWFSGGYIKRGFPVNQRDDFQGIRSVDCVAGTAPFYRKDVFDKVGLLDKRFVMYHEDVEFCLRVRNETNWKICMFAEKLVTHHAESYTLGTNKVCYYGHRNHIIILKEYYPKYIPMVLLSYLREIANLTFVSVQKLRPSCFLHTPHIIRGALDGLVTRQSRE